MKRAVILHGTDAVPTQNWFPWLKQRFEDAGYEVWAPLLPENHTPNRAVYNDFLFSKGWDFTDTIVVGHSSGAVSVLNLLMDERCPRIKLGAMVSAWKGGAPDNWEDATQFDDLFPPEGFNFELIKQKADALVFLHGDNDAFCPVEQAKYLAAQLSAPLTIIPQGGHIGDAFQELPQLWEIIDRVL